LNFTNDVFIRLYYLIGPGAYYPELSVIAKPPTFKPQPFGSTTNRFDNSAETRSKQLPAPGSYDLEAIDSLIKQVQKRVFMSSYGQRQKAFGSMSERLISFSNAKVRLYFNL
jgi:hypothetical protein